MRLCRFELRNFKGIRNGVFDWQDIAVLIGENNVGKSSILQALQCFLSGVQLKDKALFCETLSGIERPLEMIGHFCDLSQEEQQAPAVRGRMNGDKWILKKKFWSEIDGNAQIVWKEQYYSFSRLERLRNWPENESAWGNFSEDYRPLIEQIPNRGTRPTNQSRDILRALTKEQRPEMVELGEPDWIPNPGGGGNWKSNANAILPRWIYVQAVHDATDESTSKDSSTYGKIVNLIVE